MIDLARAAADLQKYLDGLGLPNCIIGGLALQAWGEMRSTHDVDFTVITNFENEEAKIDKIFDLVEPRISDAVAFALRNRVVLGYLKTLVPVDIGLGGFGYEQDLIMRARDYQFLDDLTLRVCGPEDLVITKVFAGRGKDWMDVEGILVRQKNALDWSIIEEALPALLEAVEEPERLDRLRKLRSQT